MTDEDNVASQTKNDETYRFHEAVIQNSGYYVAIFGQFMPEKLKVQDKRGRTPLSYAAELGRFEMIPMLIDDNHEIASIEDDQGSVPLHYAAKYAREECFVCLLAINSKLLTKQNALGETPISLLTVNGDTENHSSLRETISEAGEKLWKKLLSGRFVVKKLYFSISLCEVLFYCNETPPKCDTKRH